MAGLKIPVTQNDHILGRDDAAVTFLEYGDYECPHCGRAHPIVKAVKKHFGNQLRYVYRHFPLIQIHPNAEPAAESAEFAGRHDRFWEMHDYIFQNQDGLGLPLLGELAEELGLSSVELLQALQSRTYAPIVREHFMGGVRSGVNGTPTFFINGQRYEGPYEFEYLVEAIDEEIARVNTGRRRAG
ncbi:MAG: DsbA family protein [Terriglobales bacterium]